MTFLQDANIPWPLLGVLLLVYLLSYARRWAPLFETLYGYSRPRAYIAGLLILLGITLFGLLLLGVVWYTFDVLFPTIWGQVCGGGVIILLWTYLIYSLERVWRDRAFEQLDDT
ncbi:MAG: hypothetical protein M9928_07375 [Anaerolineae bacterium]|nr:hypothetical protein [Anaerolineae bacterium]MCO5188358.1 hypothetical protein [Anaerolineae bacterium]MCO5197227.1 hypothetical protein [Anaerolineae bacterium]MCO5204835.1 hypothetical protein [Anaerolineae bacterium]